ncbi:MAG: DoxX family protein [Muribaculaceae bacterium]|nr:DoxX family protein [Muribaculaceae bacterium]
MKSFFKNIFLFSAGHTYSNLSRLFLRLFVGVMFLQVCVSQFMNLGEMPTDVSFCGLSPAASMGTGLMLLSLCAAFIMLGFLTRFAVLPPMIIMCVAEWLIFTSSAAPASSLFYFQPGYPVMFIGIFLYFLLAGPGKISLDYVISAYLIDNMQENEVLEKA